MEDISIKIHQRFRLILLGLILLFLGLSAFITAKLAIHQPDDFVFSIVVVSITIAFSLFEAFLTIKNYKKEISLINVGFTTRGFLNPIPMIAVFSGLILSVGLCVSGLVFYFIREEMTIKCNAIVILLIGVYLLINCLFYISFIYYINKHKYK